MGIISIMACDAAEGGDCGCGECYYCDPGQDRTPAKSWERKEPEGPTCHRCQRQIKEGEVLSVDSGQITCADCKDPPGVAIKVVEKKVPIYYTDTSSGGRPSHLPGGW